MFFSILPNRGHLKEVLSIKQVKCENKDKDKKQEQKQQKMKIQQNQQNQKRIWTEQEQQMIFKLHNQYGNKWAIIAQNLQGRTDNSVKNHFYSRLRKGLRKLNKIISYKYKKSYKQFKIIDLYKVIEASDQKFKQVKQNYSDQSQIAFQLKNRLFLFAEDDFDSDQEALIKDKQLIDDLLSFTRQYKRKSKKNRRYSPMGVDSVYRSLIKNNIGGKSQNQQQEEQESISQKEKDQNSVNKMNKVIQCGKAEQTSNKNIVTRNQRKKLDKQMENTKRQQEFPRRTRRQKRNGYSKFSQDQEQVRHDEQWIRQQKLDNFAQNILKTFKSYYSFQSFKSNTIIDQTLH